MPYVPLISAAVVAAANLIIAVEDDTVAEFLLVVLVLLVLARQYVMLRDDLTLARTIKQREAQLHHLAFHDALTGLANRALFTDRLEHALDLAGRDRRPVSVVFLDLDGFKAVNDSFGHGVGDTLLVRVSERLRGALRAADTLARLGGDESRCWPRTLAALDAPFSFDEHSIAVSASIGVATIEPGRAGAAQAADLLHRADVAMYAVKTSGKGHVRAHSPALEVARRRDEATLSQALAAALVKGDVDASYQPLVDPDGRIAALEAFPSWVHDGIPVSPSTFLPICAQAGLLGLLTESVLERCCGQLAEWNRALGHRRLRVAVNVDPTEFADPALPDRIGALLHRHELAREQLVLEMTEIASEHRPDIAMDVMNQLRAMGVRLAVEGFGAGYSTFARLWSTPLDTVKLDRSFVSDIDHDARQRTFLAGLLELAQQLGLRTVADGVDRPGQLRVLRRLGRNLVQGEIVGQPADAAGTSALVLADRPVLVPDRYSSAE